MSVLNQKLIHALLKPLVRLFVRQGVLIPEMYEALKTVATETAAELLEAEGRKATVSAISLRSGVSRKEVDRIFKRGNSGARKLSILGRIVMRWQQDPRYVTKAGQPRVLSYETNKSDFAELVKEVSGDIHPGIVLKELQSSDLVECTSRGAKLLRKQYTPIDNFAEGYSLLATDLENLIEAVDENIRHGKKAKNIHSTTFYTSLSLKDRDIIRDFVIEETSNYHRRLRKFLVDFDLDLNPLQSREQERFQFYVSSFSKEHQLDVPEPSSK